jgi:hypothetical protein
VDGLLLEDVVARIGPGAMDGDSPNVKTANDDDYNDICCHNLAGLSFWMQMLKLNILTPLSSDPLDMSMAQRNFVSHFYSVGGDSDDVVIGGGHVWGKGNVG